jgi:hypothetical protein
LEVARTSAWVKVSDAAPSQEGVVDGRLVLQRDGADRGRQGEDDVIVGNRQQLGLAVFEPLPRGCSLTLRAVAVAAGNG